MWGRDAGSWCSVEECEKRCAHYVERNASGLQGGSEGTYDSFILSKIVSTDAISKAFIGSDEGKFVGELRRDSEPCSRFSLARPFRRFAATSELPCITLKEEFPVLSLLSVAFVHTK